MYPFLECDGMQSMQLYCIAINVSSEAVHRIARIGTRICDKPARRGSTMRSAVASEQSDPYTYAICGNVAC